MNPADQNHEAVQSDTEAVATILIAEDDSDLRAVIELRCKQAGYAVVAVEDALSALCFADVELPSLMILDVEMPGGNGLAACEMLMSDENFSHIPVIIHTGRCDEETIRRCEGLGATYVQKSPDSWEQLEQHIHEHLANPQCPQSPQSRMFPSF